MATRDNDEILTRAVKGPAQAGQNLDVWAGGRLRGWFTGDQAAFTLLKAESSPTAPASVGQGVFFFRDSGAGKAQMCVRFPSGAIQIVATEP